MNMHKNARTTPWSRGQIVARVRTEQERPAAVAAGVGISERTVRKWVARYAAGAEAGWVRVGRPAPALELGAGAAGSGPSADSGSSSSISLSPAARSAARTPCSATTASRDSGSPSVSRQNR